MGQRKILFRGKRIDNGKWAEGDLINNEGSVFIFISHGVKPNGFEYVKIGGATVGYIVEVIPESVGQFTGLTDKNGVKIFEGDIVSFKRGIGNWTGKFMTTIHGVYWDEIVSRFSLGKEQEGIKFRSHPRYEYEVIGNIHDNPSKLCPEN